MYARLSFTVATTIKPEILIIDEILGAGDAYFAQKAYDRMKNLTSNGATVLFVSHDMSAVQQLCDETIWIERGRIIMRNSTDIVAKAYADMIRKRESLRLQARNSMMKITTLENIRKNSHKILQFIFRFYGVQISIAVSRVSLIVNNNLYTFVDVGSAQDSMYTEDAFILLDGNLTGWGNPLTNNDNKHCRVITPHKDVSAIVVFNLDGISHNDKINIEIEYKGSSAQFQFYDGLAYVTIESLPGYADWHRHRCEIPSHFVAKLLTSMGYISNDSSSYKSEPFEKIYFNISHLNVEKDSTSKSEIFTGQVIIEDVVIHAKDVVPCHQFNSFDSLYIRIKYYTIADIYKPEFVICFHKAGIIALQTLSRNQDNSPNFLPAGTRAEAVFYVPELALGRGAYLISIGIFPELDRDSLDTEKKAFILHDRRYEIQISQPEGGHIDLGMVRSKCHWEFSNV
jgi:lipopolysaccharide transport system ATP-binding protein